VNAQTIYELREEVIAPGFVPTLLSQVEGILVRTFDGGRTYEMCFQVTGRWSVATPVEVRTEKWGVRAAPGK
jgi:hypothetical protein